MVHLDKVEMFCLKTLVLPWILIEFDEIRELSLALELVIPMAVYHMDLHRDQHLILWAFGMMMC